MALLNPHLAEITFNDDGTPARLVLRAQVQEGAEILGDWTRVFSGELLSQDYQQQLAGVASYVVENREDFQQREDARMKALNDSALQKLAQMQAQVLL